MKFGGPLFLGPLRELHAICGACAHINKVGGLVFGGPPSGPHSICYNLCDSEVQRTWDFIILNKSPTRPPRHTEANESHARRRAQNSSPISVPSPRSFLCCMCVCVCACLFVCLRACLFVCLLVCWLACFLLSCFLCLLTCLFACLCVWLLCFCCVCLTVFLFVCVFWGCKLIWDWLLFLCMYVCTHVSAQLLLLGAPTPSECIF